ncbi:MAG: SUMF1/EgtB/PvdO family nonheme iron enzyme [Pirellulales bacterium]
MTSDLPPFIPDQQLWLLDEIPNARPFLTPEYFRRRRGGGVREEMPDHGGEEDPWRLVTRRQLFFEHRFRRLCLATPGGIGKTTTLGWLAAESAERALRGEDQELAIYVELGALPDKCEQYLGSWKKPGKLIDAFQSWLDTVSDVNNRVVRRGSSRPGRAAGSPHQRRQDEREDLHGLLERTLRRGELLLLVDGLDQTRTPAQGKRNPKVAALAEFLAGEGAHCRVVLAGRPHALDQFWGDLFDNAVWGQRRDWRYAQLGDFTKEQQKKFLGTERFSRLQALDAEQLGVPRMLEAVRKLPLATLDTLRTASDVYAAVVTNLFDKDERVSGTRKLDRDEALRTLAAIAFALVRAGNYEGVSNADYGEFVRQLYRAQGRHVGWRNEATLKAALQELGRTNSVLDYCFLESHRKLTDIYFRNVTLLEFFAALWLARFARPEDSGWFVARPHDPHAERENENLYRVWRFLAEMPSDCNATAFRADQEWVRSLAPLYGHDGLEAKGDLTSVESDTTATRRVRSTEMLCRSWDTMERLAAKGVVDARAAMDAYRSEFRDAILSGRRGDAARAVAEEFLREFRPIPPIKHPTREQRTFQMGSTPEQLRRYAGWNNETRREAAIERPFELACVPVTNLQYELYDPSRRDRRDRLSPEDGCPVINVTWYDAVMFCRWLAPGDTFTYRLPHEIEWEYACRAPGPENPHSTSIWYFGDNEGELKNHAWYSANSEHKTHPVGQKPTTDCAHPWGLFDMYGNVWEWCGNVAKDDPRVVPKNAPISAARVLRGGSWDSIPLDVRSSIRDVSRPSVSLDCTGFRVCRVVCVARGSS